MLDYPTLNKDLPFSEYIANCQQMIRKHRLDLSTKDDTRDLIIHANSPFELYPTTKRNGQKLKTGILLIHGLLDSPFTLRELGEYLQQNGMLCRAILLPGHGTKPADLMSVSYEDWIKTMQYGIASLQQDVEQIYVLGYSTGATLSLYQALNHRDSIAGMVLLSPAVQINWLIDLAFNLHRIQNLIKRKINLSQSPWLIKATEIDYAKYQSIPAEAVSEVTKLTTLIDQLHERNPCETPLLIMMSKDDRTVSCQSMLRFFSKTKNNHSRFFLYSLSTNRLIDSRIISRTSSYPNLHIKRFSHIAIPFSKTNSHYGQQGDYPYASRIHPNDEYGAYNSIEIKLFDLLYRLNLIQTKRDELSYNPDFDFMAKTIHEFLNSTKG